MERPSFGEAQVCREQQRLLEECEKALEIWKEHQAEFRQLRSNRVEAGDKLLRLQANYARAYTVLRNHKESCALCQLIARANVPVAEKHVSEFSDQETLA